MRLSKSKSNLVFNFDSIYLVPYLKEHVSIYHAWMKSQYLLEMTASQPLTFMEELEMQESWMDDEDSKNILLINSFIHSLLTQKERTHIHHTIIRK